MGKSGTVGISWDWIKNLKLCGTSWDLIEKLDISMRAFMGFYGKIWNYGDFMGFDGNTGTMGTSWDLNGNWIYVVFHGI